MESLRWRVASKKYLVNNWEHRRREASAISVRMVFAGCHFVRGTLFSSSATTILSSLLLFQSFLKTRFLLPSPHVLLSFSSRSLRDVLPSTAHVFQYSANTDMHRFFRICDLWQNTNPWTFDGHRFFQKLMRTILRCSFQACRQEYSALGTYQSFVTLTGYRFRVDDGAHRRMRSVLWVIHLHLVADHRLWSVAEERHLLRRTHSRI